MQCENVCHAVPKVETHIAAREKVFAELYLDLVVCFSHTINLQILLHCQSIPSIIANPGLSTCDKLKQYSSFKDLVHLQF